MKESIIKKVIIILVIVIIILILLSIGVNDKDKENNSNSKNNQVQKNTNENVIKDQEFNGLSMKNTSISYLKGTGSTFTVTAINNTNDIINIETLDVIFKNENNEEVTTLKAFLGGKIEPKQENIIKLTSEMDLSQIKNIEYKVAD